MPSNYPIVWVHLGKSKIAPYLKKSLENVSELFTDYPLVLLVDHKQNVKSLEIQNLSVIKIEFLDTDWQSIKNQLEHDLRFRHEFWFNSLARFKAIYTYMEMEGLDTALHIESDVTLLPNFPIEVLRKLHDVMSYPLQGAGQGIASLLHIGSREVLAEFLSFCHNEVQKNAKSTDMSILYNFLKHRPSKVLIMPTLHSSLNHHKEYSPDRRIASEHRDLFGGVFDAISIGQYLFGVDPRNNRGIRKLYWEDENHWVKPSQYRYEFIGDTLFAREGQVDTKVFSLHIHSKDPNAFKFVSLHSLLEKRSQDSINGQKSEIIFRELFQSIYRSLMRRFVDLWH